MATKHAQKTHEGKAHANDIDTIHIGYGGQNMTLKMFL